MLSSLLRTNEGLLARVSLLPLLFLEQEFFVDLISISAHIQKQILETTNGTPGAVTNVTSCTPSGTYRDMSPQKNP